jgi:hypothetical protein
MTNGAADLPLPRRRRKGLPTCGLALLVIITVGISLVGCVDHESHHGEVRYSVTGTGTGRARVTWGTTDQAQTQEVSLPWRWETTDVSVDYAGLATVSLHAVNLEDTGTLHCEVDAPDTVDFSGDHQSNRTDSEGDSECSVEAYYTDR